MKIGLKLIAGFLVIAILVLVSGLFGINYVNKVRNSTDIISLNAEFIDLIQEIRVSAIQLVMPANDYIILGDKEEIKNFENLLNTTKERFVNFLNFIAEHEDFKIHTKHTVNGKELLVHIEEDILEVEYYSNQIFNLDDPVGNSEGAILTEKMDAQADNLIEDFTILTEHAKEDMAAATQTTNSIGITSRNNLTGIVIVAVALAVIIGFFMSRSISNPVAKLKEAAEEVSKGNLDIKVDVKSKDEIGSLANTFNIMTIKIKNLKRAKKVQKLQDELAALEQGYRAKFISAESYRKGKERIEKGLKIIKNSSSKNNNPVKKF